jgi:hypothetical protein
VRSVNTASRAWTSPTLNIDGGHADVGMTVYLPCLGGIIAVKATRSPPSLHLLWSSSAGGGPPIVAGGLVWTIGQDGKLYGLDPATGKIRQQATVGTPANHFPTPGIGDGLLLATCAQNVIAFRTSAAASQSHGATTRAATGACDNSPPGPPVGGRDVAEIAIACLVAVGVFGCFIWLVRRQRRA